MTSSNIALDIWQHAVAAANPEAAILTACMSHYNELSPLLNDLVVSPNTSTSAPP